MDSGLNVYLVELETLHKFVGSGSEKLLKTVRGRLGPELSPTADEALSAVVHGGPFSDDEEDDVRYAHAYELLCSAIGTRLHNSSFAAFEAGWLRTVDEALDELRISAVSVEAFDDDELPDDLPPVDRPGCGEWTAHEIKKALQQYEAAVSSGRAPQLEPMVSAAVDQCVGWLRTAKATRGLGIIGFVS